MYQRTFSFMDLSKINLVISYLAVHPLLRRRTLVLPHLCGRWL